MSILDVEIYRIYRCCACQGEIGYAQKPTDDWIKTCPLCNKDELLLHKAISNISTIVGFNDPKTLGALAEKNSREREKQGLSNKGIKDKGEKPWWRKNSKINFDVLKNPNRYIEQGKI